MRKICFTLQIQKLFTEEFTTKMFRRNIENIAERTNLFTVKANRGRYLAVEASRVKYSREILAFEHARVAISISNVSCLRRGGSESPSTTREHSFQNRNFDLSGMNSAVVIVSSSITCLFNFRFKLYDSRYTHTHTRTHTCFS